MKKMSLVLAAMMAISLFLPGMALADEKVPVIGVVQFVQHEALDRANQGFVDALKDNGFVVGENIRLDQQKHQRVAVIQRKLRRAPWSRRHKAPLMQRRQRLGRHGKICGGRVDGGAASAPRK